MKRSKRLLVVHHCLLNQNARATGLAKREGVVEEIVAKAREEKAGIYQIPCPELRLLGIGRPPLTKTQYDIPEFRRICRDIAREVGEDLERFARGGCKMTIIGVRGSPSCGVNYTHILDEKGKELLVEGKGILVEEIEAALLDKGIEFEYYEFHLNR